MGLLSFTPSAGRMGRDHQSMGRETYFSRRLYARLSEIMPSIERTGLFVTDVEILRLHYAETLKAWHERFQARRRRLRPAAGLASAACGSSILPGANARSGARDLSFSQIQLSKKLETVPVTRDYIGHIEAYLRKRDAIGRTCGWQ